MPPELSTAAPWPRYHRETVEVRDARAELLQDFREGMLHPPRSLPPKYFYDARGSQLFDAICETPEYYPTRLEEALLREHADTILQCAGADTLIELGSGSSRKTEHLLQALQVRSQQPGYIANDVCASILDATAQRLLARHGLLEIQALCGDYAAALEWVSNAPEDPERGRLFAFLGSSLGNFEDPAAVALLSAIGGCMRPHDRLLLGLDRIKPVEILEAAYNDATGVTAAFNRNLLAVLNRELGADFDLDGFEHQARFVPEHARIEMHLVAQRDQRVQIRALAAELEITAGERILTEISRKFDRSMVERLLADAGLRQVAEWSAPDEHYSLLLLASA